MTIIAIVPAIVAILGALTYAFASDKLSELGRIAFFVGLFVIVLGLAGHVVRVG